MFRKNIGNKRSYGLNCATYTGQIERSRACDIMDEKIMKFEINQLEEKQPSAIIQSSGLQITDRERWVGRSVLQIAPL